MSYVVSGTVHDCTCLMLSQVQPKHVKEGFRLLNKSIIRVETPDINFDEDEQIINGGWCHYTVALSIK